MFGFRTAVACAFLFSASTAYADPMPSADVMAYFAAGTFKATAGSAFTFNADGTFAIKHSNGSEKGTWAVAPDGTVTRMRAGASKPDIFFIDVDANGKKTIVYTAGQYKGKKFGLK